MTLAFLNISQAIYLIISFSLDEWIQTSEILMIMVSICIGALMGSSAFIYLCILPLKIVSHNLLENIYNKYSKFWLRSLELNKGVQAKDITEREIRRLHHGNSSIEIHKISYVGTIIGVTLGTTYLLNTLLFVNVAFIIDKIGENLFWICFFLCLLLVLSVVALYQDIKKELYSFKCVRRCCPNKKIKSYKMRVSNDT